MNGRPPTSASNKVIISCAITGAIHVPSLTPHLPITPKQIAENAIGAAEAGAAIVHLHARDPGDGRPTPDPEVFAQFLPEIGADRKSTRLNSSHANISYAVFCLKK